MDEFTREALCGRAATKAGSEDILETLHRLTIQRGTPTDLRSDNGPEFIAEPRQNWRRKMGVEPMRIVPGSPWENSANERSNRTLR